MRLTEEIEELEHHYTRYVKGLQEEVQILKEIKDINEKIIQVKDERISDLQTKVDKLLELLNDATSLMQHRVLTFKNEPNETN